eukprot:CAMPEP_0170467746 /NCGR_PEP_ID=MMETSP0123-20130129/11214_1 /TAXON_ID=182087 /ORGANISM="Favella ehrenbergii, Strain Fehren 1" /LENGTH=212 /DNA_ID=CAMNT_0010734199 /DNA_START=512 /DNA_END=1147 /DNA_ORIENTATION=+
MTRLGQSRLTKVASLAPSSCKTRLKLAILSAVLASPRFTVTGARNDAHDILSVLARGVIDRFEHALVEGLGGSRGVSLAHRHCHQFVVVSTRASSVLSRELHLATRLFCRHVQLLHEFLRQVVKLGDKDELFLGEGVNLGPDVLQLLPEVAVVNASFRHDALFELKLPNRKNLLLLRQFEHESIGSLELRADVDLVFWRVLRCSERCHFVSR